MSIYQLEGKSKHTTVKVKYSMPLYDVAISQRTLLNVIPVKWMGIYLILEIADSTLGHIMIPSPVFFFFFFLSLSLSSEMEDPHYDQEH